VSMKRKALLALAAFALLASTAVAQDVPPAPSARPALPAPATPPAPAAFAVIFDSGHYLGVHVEDITRENAARYQMTGEPRGVGVREVFKGSPAEKAGLKAGDVILRFDGEAVTSVRKLTRLIEESAPEHTARLTISRNGSEQELSATLASDGRPFQAAEGGALPGFALPDMKPFEDEWGKNAEKWRLQGEEMGRRLEELQREHPGVFALGGRHIGVTTSPLGRQLADYFGVSHGVLINSVESGGPADKAGLKAGDVITEADGRQVNDAGDLVRALDGKGDGKDDGEVTLTYTRERKQHTARVKPGRGGPQGLYINPGDFRVVAPAISVVPPRVMVAPRVVTSPRVRVPVPPVRVRVLGSGDRIL
jgi:membrane-associated protease RseP (regulator of RpoE activity)